MFNYTNPDFINANQGGEITLEQRRMVLRAQGGWFGFVVILIFMFFLFPLCLLGYLAFVTRLPDMDTWFYRAVALCATLIAIAFIVHLIRHRRLSDEIKTAQIKYAEGLVRWNGHQYIAEADSHVLKHDTHVKPITVVGHYEQLSGLSPGAYGFFIWRILYGCSQRACCITLRLICGN